MVTRTIEIEAITYAIEGSPPNRHRHATVVWRINVAATGWTCAIPITVRMGEGAVAEEDVVKYARAYLHQLTGLLHEETKPWALDAAR